MLGIQLNASRRKDERGLIVARRGSSNQDTFDLVEADGVAGAVVEFSGAGRLVACDPLSMLKPAVKPQVRGDPRSSKRVAARRGREPRLASPAFHHSQNIRSMHATVGQ